MLCPYRFHFRCLPLPRKLPYLQQLRLQEAHQVYFRCRSCLLHIQHLDSVQMSLMSNMVKTHTQEVQTTASHIYYLQALFYKVNNRQLQKTVKL